MLIVMINAKTCFTPSNYIVCNYALLGTSIHSKLKFIYLYINPNRFIFSPFSL